MDGNVIEGKAFWSWIHEPNISSNPEWSLRIVPSEIEQQRFKKAGYKMQMEQINNKDFGLSIFIRRKVKHMDDVLERPLLFDKDKKKLELFEKLPNGSNVMVKYNEWESTLSNNKSIKGIDLIAVMLLDETPSLF
ncbi:hypothetical protein N8209_02080 [Gammaproteobacteria bacterium]|jgi:hypothetical protein|nr:hypothetical protein [Gammaproteobacteria bacterium]MDC1189573.1 hypothetical protein [Gammaproteobacteria bacterium]